MPFNSSDEIERLKRELEGVTAERDYLLAENRRLTHTTKDTPAPDRIAGFKSVSDFIPSTNTMNKLGLMTLLNNDSHLAEKVRQFRSLFHGREDVYPIMWQNKTTLKVGYIPACKNEWVSGLCNKFKVRCSDCPNRELALLTNQVIQNHLEGKITAGVYPLLRDDTCYFLAIDFDK